MVKLAGYTEFGWNGTVGFCAHDGRVGLVINRPSFSFTYDVINYSSDLAVPDFKVINRVPYALSPTEILEVSTFAINNATDAGKDPVGDSLVTDIIANPYAGSLTLLRTDGKTEDVPLSQLVQLVPAYSLACYNIGNHSEKIEWWNMVKGDAVDKCGVGLKSWDDLVEMPAKLFTAGGSVKGGQWNETDNTWYVGANSVEVTAQLAFMWGIHPDNPKYAMGWPAGRHTTRLVVEQMQPNGSWVKIHSVDYNHGSGGTNGAPQNKQCWMASGTSFKFVVANASWIRFKYGIAELGSFYGDAEVLPYIRMFAYPEGYGDGSRHYQQVQGVIKDVSPSTPIPPKPTT